MWETVMEEHIETLDHVVQLLKNQSDYEAHQVAVLIKIAGYEVKEVKNKFDLYQAERNARN